MSKDNYEAKQAMSSNRPLTTENRVGDGDLVVHVGGREIDLLSLIHDPELVDWIDGRYEESPSTLNPDLQFDNFDKEQEKKKQREEEEAQLRETILSAAQHPLWDSFRSHIGQEASKTGIEEVDERPFVPLEVIDNAETRQNLMTDWLHLHDPETFEYLFYFRYQAQSGDDSLVNLFEEWKERHPKERASITGLLGITDDLRQLQIDYWNALKPEVTVDLLSKATQRDKTNFDIIMHPHTSAEKRSKAEGELSRHLAHVAREYSDQMNKLLRLNGWTEKSETLTPHTEETSNTTNLIPVASDVRSKVAQKRARQKQNKALRRAASEPLWESFRAFAGESGSETGIEEIDTRPRVPLPEYTTEGKQEIMYKLTLNAQKDPHTFRSLFDLGQNVQSTTGNILDRYKVWKDSSDLLRSGATAFFATDLDYGRLEVDSFKNVTRDQVDRLDNFMNPDLTDSERDRMISTLPPDLAKLGTYLSGLIRTANPLEGFSAEENDESAGEDSNGVV